MVQVCVFLALIPGCARGIAPLPYTLETCNPPRQGVQRHAGTGYIGNGRKASWAAQLVSNPQKACRPKPGGAMAKLLAIVARGGEETLQWRSEEHTSELQSLMRISYAVFCLKKNKKNKIQQVHGRTRKNITKRYRNRTHT